MAIELVITDQKGASYRLTGRAAVMCGHLIGHQARINDAETTGQNLAFHCGQGLLVRPVWTEGWAVFEVEEEVVSA